MIFNNFLKELFLLKLAIAFANVLKLRILSATILNFPIFDLTNKQKFK